MPVRKFPSLVYFRFNFDHFWSSIKVTHQRALRYVGSQLQFDLQISTFTNSSFISLFALNQTLDCLPQNKSFNDFLFHQTISSVHSSCFASRQNLVLLMPPHLIISPPYFGLWYSNSNTIVINFNRVAFWTKIELQNTEIPCLPWKYRLTSLLNNIQIHYKTNNTLHSQKIKQNNKSAS